MKPFSVLALILFVSLPAFAQQRWERNYGGTGEDYGRSVQQTSDGGYVVAGETNSFGNRNQVYLIKTNVVGDTLWTRTFGGVDNDWGRSVQVTSDGGYIITGLKYSFGAGYNDVYLIKTNASGDTLWTRHYGGMGDEWGNSVQQTSDTGYIVAGYTVGQVYLIKTNASGDTIWTRDYGGTGYDEGCSVQQTSDTGYIVAGYSTSFGNRVQVYLIKTNAFGDTLWTRNYGGAIDDAGLSVQQTSDGGYVITGLTNSFGDSSQVYLIRVNAFGDTLWTKTYGGSGFEEGYSVQQTTDGGYIVAGWTNSFGNIDQVYLIKTNTVGDTLWTRKYGGDYIDQGRSVQQTLDGGYIIAGYTYSYGNFSQVYLIKTDSVGRSTGVEENKGFEGPRVQGVKATPNPFTSFASVLGHEAERFAVFDIAGRKVGTYPGSRIGEGLAPGVYFLRAEDGTAKPLRIVKVR